MNPWDLIPWAFAIGFSILIVMLPLTITVGLISLALRLK